MSDEVANALIATALGSVVAIVLLIPVAAYEYRRDGRLGPGDLAVCCRGPSAGPPCGPTRCSRCSQAAMATCAVTVTAGSDPDAVKPKLDAMQALADSSFTVNLRSFLTPGAMRPVV